jgi:hypothetical protein
MNEDLEKVIKALDPDLHERIAALRILVEQFDGQDYVTALLVAATIGCEELERNSRALEGSLVVARDYKFVRTTTVAYDDLPESVADGLLDDMGVMPEWFATEVVVTIIATPL